MKPSIISYLNDYFEKNKKPIVSEIKKNNAKKDKQDDSVINQIKDILNTKIRPAVAKDGGNIQFKSFKDGVVKVELQGACSGCPSSTVTLKRGVENMLRHYVPEVNSVESI